jgi:hypothetical protein
MSIFKYKELYFNNHFFIDICVHLNNYGPNYLIILFHLLSIIYFSLHLITEFKY